jgi:hypothetical protein
MAQIHVSKDLSGFGIGIGVLYMALQSFIRVLRAL